VTRSAASSTRKRRARKTCLVVTCEHGGNRIPRHWAALFRNERAALDSHRGWDIGALDYARRLSTAYDAPLIAHTASRLIIDVNRSPRNPSLFSSITRGLPAAERERILRDLYRPYRAHAFDAIAAAIARGDRVVHVSAHSFTPIWNGVRRGVDVALLYDPSRRSEKALCDAWLAALKAELPTYALRRNSPYRGVADGLTTALRREHPPQDYIGIEVEVNQRFAKTRDFEVIVAALVSTLRPLLA
jgi:predicted N-formylglutamate amidohydrolase